MSDQGELDGQAARGKKNPRPSNSGADPASDSVFAPREANADSVFTPREQHAESIFTPAESVAASVFTPREPVAEPVAPPGDAASEPVSWDDAIFDEDADEPDSGTGIDTITTPVGRQTVANAANHPSAAGEATGGGDGAAHQSADGDAADRERAAGDGSAQQPGTGGGERTIGSAAAPPERSSRSADKTAGTVRKPGKPSSGSLRIPDWMRENDSDATTAADRLPPERSKKPMILAAAGVPLAVLLVGVGVYAIGGEDEKKPAASQSRPSTTAPSSPAPTTTPPAAKRLPQWSGAPSHGQGRVIDRKAGLSYPKLAAPWQVPQRQTSIARLGFATQQYVVTERTGGRERHGQLASGPLTQSVRPAYTGPGSELPAAQALAAEVEKTAYDFKHQQEAIASQRIKVGKHKGWLLGFKVRYKRAGVKARAEVYTVAVIGNGRKRPGMLFMAVPNTHKKLWPDINFVLRNIKPLKKPG